MLHLDEIVGYLDGYLKIGEIEDTSVNGLQVQGRGKVERIGFAVDACMETFKEADGRGADMLVVHHGLIWGGIKSVTGITYDRLKFLIENGISLYAVHLPLDKHPEVGNNIQFLKLFDVSDIKEFGQYHGVNIGFMGEFKEEKVLGEFAEEVGNKLNTKPGVLDFGKEKIRKVGVVSGAASSVISEAVEKVDVFVTGEVSHSVYHSAKDARVNVIFAGHYATETLGVKALAGVLEKEFGMETVFIDVPTGL